MTDSSDLRIEELAAEQPADFPQPPGQQPHPGSIINVLTTELTAVRDELAFVKAALNEREVWIQDHMSRAHPQPDPAP